MKFGENVFSMTLLIIVVSMYVYAFATGIAITHSDYGDECPICALANDAANWNLSKLLRKQQVWLFLLNGNVWFFWAGAYSFVNYYYKKMNQKQQQWYFNSASHKKLLLPVETLTGKYPS